MGGTRECSLDTVRETAGWRLPDDLRNSTELKLSLVTAQRIGEVTGIAQSELSLKDGEPMWIVPGSRTKNGRPNRVPLSPITLA